MDNSDLTGEQPDFNTLPASKRVRILVAHPEHADKCDWKQMRKVLDGQDWTLLLSNQPQFAEHCRWTTLDGGDWARLLAAQPQFADKCDWEAMEYDDWAQLLAAQPQFADKCHCWEEFSDEEWDKLVEKQPQLAKYREPPSH